MRNSTPAIRGPGCSWPSRRRPAAEEPFDACDVFTQADAEAALGTAARRGAGEPKVRRPKVIATCTYNGFKDGKPVAATVQFRFGRTEAEAQQRLRGRAPAVPDQAPAHLRRRGVLEREDRPDEPAQGSHLGRRSRWARRRSSERDMDEAKKLAEILATKI